MTGSFRAFLDATVLYPVTLRNLLMRLTLSGLFQARWPAHVHEEWIRAVLRDRPDVPIDKLHRVRDLMDLHAGDSLVIGYEPLIGSLSLPDPDDRHVLAAAIVARADVIITHNLRHFPEHSLAPYNIEAQRPDAFVRHLIDLSPVLVVDTVRAQQARLVNPPVTLTALLNVLERLGLVETATELRRLTQTRETER